MLCARIRKKKIASARIRKNQDCTKGICNIGETTFFFVVDAKII